MQLESFHWLSHHGIWAIIPWSTKMASVCVIFGPFCFYCSLVFYILGAFLIKRTFVYKTNICLSSVVWRTFGNVVCMRSFARAYDTGILRSNDAQCKRPYWYSRYWTGTSLEWRLKRLTSFTFEWTPRISLNCKIFPVQYREYLYGLFEDFVSMAVSHILQAAKFGLDAFYTRNTKTFSTWRL